MDAQELQATVDGGAKRKPWPVDTWIASGEQHGGVVGLNPANHLFQLSRVHNEFKLLAELSL